MRQELGLENVVAFAGLRRDVLDIVTRAANVLFSTSLHEGFPNVVIEAMSVGTPVVSTDYSDIRLILPNDWQVVERPESVDLADAIVRADSRDGRAISRQQKQVAATRTRHWRRRSIVSKRSIGSTSSRESLAPNPTSVSWRRTPGLCWPMTARVKSAGGAQVQQTLLAKALVRRGFRVSMICFDYGQPDRAVVDGVTVFKCHAPIQGLPVIRFFHPRLTGLWSALRRVDADIYYQRAAGAATGVTGSLCEAIRPTVCVCGRARPRFWRATRPGSSSTGEPDGGIVSSFSWA